MTYVGPVPRRHVSPRVTEADIRAARTAWWDARERGDSDERVAALWADLVRLFRAEAEQNARDRSLREARSRANVPRQRGMSLLG